MKSDKGYNILAAKEEKSCVKKKERNKREREREKRKGSKKKQESFVQLKLKVRKLAKKNRIQQQLIPHRTCAVSVYSHMNRTSNRAQEQRGWSVFVVDGFMKNILIMWSMMKLAKRSSVLHVVLEMFV